MFPVKTILHPTDFSDSSRCAFVLASSLAREHGARLVVLYVNQTLGPMVAFDEIITGLSPRKYREKLSELIHRLRPAHPEVSVEYRLEDGAAVDKILRTAEQAGCDLIVMGTHGRSAVGRTLLGSVAQQVVRKALCTVVTVRAPRHRATSRPPARPQGAASLREGLSALP
jgi:nucleotide-binding universal stress UspA family protein